MTKNKPPRTSTDLTGPEIQPQNTRFQSSFEALCQERELYKTKQLKLEEK